MSMREQSNQTKWQSVSDLEQATTLVVPQVYNRNRSLQQASRETPPANLKVLTGIKSKDEEPRHQNNKKCLKSSSYQMWKMLQLLCSNPDLNSIWCSLTFPASYSEIFSNFHKWTRAPLSEEATYLIHDVRCFVEVVTDEVYPLFCMLTQRSVETEPNTLRRILPVGLWYSLNKLLSWCVFLKSGRDIAV